MKLYALAGKPALHSKSPFMHNAAFAYAGIEAYYTRLAVDSAQEMIRVFTEAGLSGMNVTAPFKADAAAAADKLDESSAAVGAVNTLVRNGGRILGYNTDPAGIVETLKRNGVTVQGKRCLTLGAGSAARAAAYGLAREGAEVLIANRTYEKAAAAARALGCKAVKISKLDGILRSGAPSVDILISTVPHEADIITPKLLQGLPIILDAVYHGPAAAPTPVNVIPGEQWLLNQALPAYRLFTGKEPDRAVMEKALEKNETPFKGRRKKIFLIGFMGCGKTSAGRILADRLAYNFIDTDALIEANQGKSISDIFRLKGEGYFRLKEKEALRKTRTESACVVSCGGGVLDDDNNEFMEAQGIRVYLYSSLSTCLNRIDSEARPLIAGGNARAKAEKLFEDRQKRYGACSDLIVNAEKSPSAVAEKICSEYECLLV